MIQLDLHHVEKITGVTRQSGDTIWTTLTVHLKGHDTLDEEMPKVKITMFHRNDKPTLDFDLSKVSAVMS